MPLSREEKNARERERWRKLIVGHRQRWIECDECGERRATVRTGVHVARGMVFLFCLRCRLRLKGVL